MIPPERVVPQDEREPLSDWLEAHHAQANPTEVRLLEREIAALKAANRNGKHALEQALSTHPTAPEEDA